MIVVKQLTSEFKIQLITELSNTLLDLFGLYLQIFLVIETFLHMEKLFSIWSTKLRFLPHLTKQTKQKEKLFLKFNFSFCFAPIG